MSDATPTPPSPAAPPEAPPIAVAAGFTAIAWKAVTAFFAPIASLITARTLWTGLLLLGLGFAIGWKDVRLFLLSGVWAIVGVAIAYHARKILMPDIKLGEFYDLVKAGNLAAAVLVLAVNIVQATIIMVVALAALKSGV